jgi:hypothetical protein
VTTRPNSFVPSGDELRRAFGDKSAADVVFFVRQCLERGGFDHAVAVGEALDASVTADPALALALAVAHFVGGDRARALASVRALVNARPDDWNARYVLAEILARTGEKRDAIATLGALVEAYPDYPGAQALLASLVMPGPPYREVLAAIHRALAPQTYLEIGVELGGTLALARSARVAVGVDPADFPIEQPLPPSTRIFRETSDAFFERSRESVFGESTVDLAFIDGMHLFEFALRDFAHTEAWCARDSTIVLHDCVPLAAVAAERERRTRFWVGDTWKAVWALSRHRPDLRIRTILTPPSGLVVVRRLDPSSTTISDAFADIERELSSLPYPLSADRFPDELHVVSNDATGLSDALG